MDRGFYEHVARIHRRANGNKLRRLKNAGFGMVPDGIRQLLKTLAEVANGQVEPAPQFHRVGRIGGIGIPSVANADPDFIGTRLDRRCDIHVKAGQRLLEKTAIFTIHDHG